MPVGSGSVLRMCRARARHEGLIELGFINPKPWDVPFLQTVLNRDDSTPPPLLYAGTSQYP